MKLTIALAIAVSMPFGFFAQQPSGRPDGSVKGVVQDEQGYAIPGATVSARMVSSGTAFMRTVIANDKGDYSVSLPAGSYEICASFPRFSDKCSKLAVRSGRNKKVTFQLAVAGGPTVTKSRPGAAPVLKTTRSAEEDSIREAVFRYLFDHNASGAQKDAEAFCLSVGKKRKDPTDSFIMRFSGYNPPVQKASRCKVRNDSLVVDIRTGKPSLIFRVSTINWISESEVETEGGYYEGNMSASGATYRVLKHDGAWTVSKALGGWIS